MFHIYLTIAYLYVLVRFVYPLPLSWMSRGLIGFVLLVASKYHLLSVLFYGNMWSPELPFAVVLVLGWLFCSFVLLFVFTLVTDVVSLLVRIIGGRDALNSVGIKLRIGAAVAAASFGGFGVYQAIQVPEVHRVELAIEGLPAELDGFRFVQLSDLHISRLFPEPWVRAVVERTNTLSADLIVITGDFIDGSTEARRADVAPLSDLRALHGVIGIPGNHEYYFSMPGVQLVEVMPANFISQGGCHAATAVVALTHDPRLDDLTLMEAVMTPAFYIGAMGSRRTSEKRLERVRRIGQLDDQSVGRIHAPIGLNLGSKTPAEIALAVMADIVRVSNGIVRSAL